MAISRSEKVWRGATLKCPKNQHLVFQLRGDTLGVSALFAWGQGDRNEWAGTGFTRRWCMSCKERGRG